ncbi:MAG: metal-dependent hydrolase [Acidobacteria bacterium]|nr:metal-dependent hydrolase [Acidobacteriota bacterium]
MDNLTHTLVGLAAARAGLERASPYATAVCVVAANLPDADIIALLGGQWFYLEHHRGITHSIAGTLALALALPVLFYYGERLIARLRGTEPRARLKGLLLCSLIVSASHPLLDWTNNYGVRPLLPWDGLRIYGDLVFILDPWLWLALGGSLFILVGVAKWRIALWALLGLTLTAAILFLPMRVGMEIPSTARVLWVVGIACVLILRRTGAGARWGAAIPATALALVVVYWGTLSLLHARAFSHARENAQRLAGERNEDVLRLAAMPVLADPLTWRCLAETDRATLMFDLSLRPDGGAEVGNLYRVEKPEGEARALVTSAAEDPRARVLLDFARFPASKVARECAGATLVQFADLRFTLPGDRSRGGSFALEVPVGAP